MWFYNLYSKTHYVVYNVHICTAMLKGLWAVKLPISLLACLHQTRPRTLTASRTDEKWAIIHTKCSFEEHDSQDFLLARVAVGGRWCTDKRRQSRGRGVRAQGARKRVYVTECIHDSCLLSQHGHPQADQTHTHTNTHTLPKPAMTAVSNTLGGHMPSCPDSDMSIYTPHHHCALYWST